MKRHIYQGVVPETPLQIGMSNLPLERPIAVYYRQSTDAQIGNVSTTMQTVDMVNHLEARGWGKDSILMIDMDGGISGTTKIDERPGMKKLFDLITDGKLGAVACQDEDRLFRDVTQIQVNIFIEACRQTQTMVLTPSMVYDFAHPQMGTFHARQFRFKSEMSAEYITAYIRGRLHPAKKRRMMEGKWAGWSVPLGYLVDERKLLPDGSPNPTFRKYVPYEPFAEIVRVWFNNFLANAGNINATVKHIYENGPYYPNPKTTTVPDGLRFVPSYRLKDYGKGYCLGDSGLTGMFTNAAYIGHWAVNSTIVIWNNHQPIIDEQTFFQAYNYLADVNLDGEANPHHNPYHVNSRPTLEENRTVDRPLFSGMLYTDLGTKVQRAGTRFVGQTKSYAYTVTNHYPRETTVWWKRADYVDAALTGLLLEKLRATFQSDEWERAIGNYKGKAEEERRFKVKQIDVLQQTMNNLLLSLETLTHIDMIKRVQSRYAEAEREHQRLSTDIHSSEAEVTRYEALIKLRASCTPALNRWVDLPRAEKLVVIQSFVAKVMVSPLEDNAISLTVRWQDGTFDVVTLVKQTPTYKEWMKADKAHLLSLVDQGASQLTICAAFPHRTWNSIRNQVWMVRGRGSLQVSPLPMRDCETYLDYIKRTDGVTVSHKARTGEHWNENDLSKLKAMVENGATQVELAAAFPHRNWGRLRHTITKLCGSNVTIPGTASENGYTGTIRKYENYEMYRQRIAGQITTETSEDSLSHPSSQDHSGKARHDAKG